MVSPNKHVYDCYQHWWSLTSEELFHFSLFCSSFYTSPHLLPFTKNAKYSHHHLKYFCDLSTYLLLLKPHLLITCCTLQHCIFLLKANCFYFIFSARQQLAFTLLNLTWLYHLSPSFHLYACIISECHKNNYLLLPLLHSLDFAYFPHTGLSLPFPFSF